MRTSRRRVEELLWVLGLHKVTGALWEMGRGSRAMRQTRLMREFYSRLVGKGALVFDIGANVGTLTRVFASLGAKVVAVEPNPDCVRHIQLATSRESVEVLQAAAGERGGLAVLKVSDRKDKMSSLSDAWREAVSKQNTDYIVLWKRELTVPIITLDAMIERYGPPLYIKIDAEGYEEQILRGLSHCPPLLSFEFNKFFMDSAMRSLDSALFERAIFNYTLVDPVEFELQGWVDRSTLKKKLVGLGGGPGLGDIFIRSNDLGAVRQAARFPRSEGSYGATNGP